jgi:hypothetical protein
MESLCVSSPPCMASVSQDGWVVSNTASKNEEEELPTVGFADICAVERRTTPPCSAMSDVEKPSTTE